MIFTKNKDSRVNQERKKNTTIEHSTINNKKLKYRFWFLKCVPRTNPLPKQIKSSLKRKWTKHLWCCQSYIWYKSLVCAHTVSVWKGSCRLLLDTASRWGWRERKHAGSIVYPTFTFLFPVIGGLIPINYHFGIKIVTPWFISILIFDGIIEYRLHDRV